MRATVSLLLVWALASLCASSVLVAQQPSSPPPLTEKIVFESNRDGDFDIWMINPDGTDLTVSLGQGFQFEIEDGECESEIDDGMLEIEGASLTLQITCTDAAGNRATATAELVDPARDDDDGDSDSDFDSESR